MLKARTTDAARVDRLLNAVQSEMRWAFVKYVKTLQASTPVMVAFTAARGPASLDHVMVLIEPHIKTLAAVRTRLFRMVGKAEIVSLKARMTVQKADITVTATALQGLSFNPDDERAAEIMDESDLAFITQFTDAQRDVVRSALVKALREGKGTAAAARSFRNVVGLTSYQMNAVDNYRSALERGSSEALDRALRDRRFDATVEAAVATDEPLTAAQVDRMVDSYATRYVAQRADTIARTESIRVLNQARDVAINQTVDSMGFDDRETIRTWTATQDARTRDTHAAMDGQQRGLNDPFDSPSGVQLMYPGDPDAPADEVINCRCVLLFSIGPAAGSTADAEQVDETNVDET